MISIIRLQHISRQISVVYNSVSVIIHYCPIADHQMVSTGTVPM